MHILLQCPDVEVYEELRRVGLSPKVWICEGNNYEEKRGDTIIYGHRILKHGNVNPIYCSIPRSIYDNTYNKAFPFFERTIERAIRTESDRTRSWADKRHQFDIMIKWYYHLITKNEIDILIFSSIPHEGTNIILYFLGREMGVKTLLTYQTLFPNQFLIVESFDDIGVYKTSKKSSQEGLYIDVTDNITSPFYMRRCDSTLNIRKKLVFSKIESAINIIRNPLRKMLGKNPKHRYRRVINYKQRLEMLNFHKNISKNINLAEPYVYFPLHLQPEMTVDILGHRYADQLSAVEALRQILPEDVRIYVKENPKQTIYARESHFFKRLFSIPNTYYVNMNFNTYDLIKNSLAVATIVGTAGWEALRMGKPVIVFGYAWYRCFPGVFDWDKGVEWNDILKYKYDKDILKKTTRDFSKYLNEGCVDRDYTELIENFNKTENAKKVVASILEYIKFSEWKDKPEGKFD